MMFTESLSSPFLEFIYWSAIHDELDEIITDKRTPAKMLPILKQLYL